MDVYKALGNRIKEKRMELGLSQDNLAEICNLSTSFIGVIERSEKRASVETIVKIANAMKVTMDYLFSDSINYDNSYDIDKAHELISDMDENEAEYAIEMLNTFREFRGKKIIE